MMADPLYFSPVILPPRETSPGEVGGMPPGSTRRMQAFNDNFSCFEQYVFERAVMRELSGDVDF